MSQTSQVRVRITHIEQHLSFSADDLNQVSTARHATSRLSDLLDELPGGSENGSIISNEDRAAVRLDLSQLDWLSSAALNELIDMNRITKSCGLRFVLENVHESLRDVFALTRLERMFEFESHGATDVDVENTTTR